MGEYLGGTIIRDLVGTPFENYSQIDWGFYFITVYAQLNGNYKETVIDNIARILNGSEVIVSLHTWDTCESEYRLELVPSHKYKAWVSSMVNSDDGICQYDSGYNTLT